MTESFSYCVLGSFKAVTHSQKKRLRVNWGHLSVTRVSQWITWNTFLVGWTCIEWWSSRDTTPVVVTHALTGPSLGEARHFKQQQELADFHWCNLLLTIFNEYRFIWHISLNIGLVLERSQQGRDLSKNEEVWLKVKRKKT